MQLFYCLLVYFGFSLRCSRVPSLMNSVSNIAVMALKLKRQVL